MERVPRKFLYELGKKTKKKTPFISRLVGSALVGPGADRRGPPLVDFAALALLTIW